MRSLICAGYRQPSNSNTNHFGVHMGREYTSLALLVTNHSSLSLTYPIYILKILVFSFFFNVFFVKKFIVFSIVTTVKAFLV